MSQNATLSQDTDHHNPPRTEAAFLAGSAGIVVNMVALALCDAAGIETARGGLLKLVRQCVGFDTPGPIGQQAFHFGVGLLMALAYAYMFEPRLRGNDLRKGLLYAAFVWILNAAFVLPVTGEGFAGGRHISLAGMVLFGVAHTLFFAILGVGYGRLVRAPKRS